MDGVYATAWEISDYIKVKDKQGYQVTDSRLFRFAVQASRKFDKFCGRVFLPRRETRYYDHPSKMQRNASFPLSPTSLASPYPNVNLAQADTTRLKLDDDLLAVVALTTNNGNTIITANNYNLMVGEEYNLMPYSAIQLLINGTQTNFLYTGTTQRANEVDGIWGYHEEYAEAWQQIDTVQSDPLTVAATSVLVNGADDDDEMGLRPRFQEQQLLRFGTTDTAEMSYLKKVDYTANTLTIKRGVNGSTAAQVPQGTPIQVWRPHADIVGGLLVLAAYVYRRKDSVGTQKDQTLAASGVLILPSKLPDDVKDEIGFHRRILIG